MLGLYNTLLHFALVLSLPLWPFILLFRGRYRCGLSERLGVYPASTRGSLRGARPVWIHASSVGEVKSAAPLLAELKRRWPNARILVSTMTATGRKTAQESLAGADAVVYFPLDLPWVVARVLRRVDPAALVLLETEVWPNAIHGARRRGIPVILLSGRLSQRSARRFHRFAGVFERVLREVSAFGMQDSENAARLKWLGVDPARVSVTGSLKRALLPLPEAPAAFASLTGHRSRPVVVIGSTHRGEEDIFVQALQQLLVKFPDLLLIVAPRHPERFEEVAGLLERSGLRYRRRSDPGLADVGDCEVLLLDSLGELAWIYEWATVVFLGGTLAQVGGHNLIEPARCSKPILLGPHTANVAGLARAMLEAGGAVEVRTKDDIVRCIADLLEHDERAAEMGHRARAVAAEDPGVISETLGLLCKFIQSPSEEG